MCLAFQDPEKAARWCMHVQNELLCVEWPQALLSHPSAAEDWGDVDDRLIFKVGSTPLAGGLRTQY
jgi:hypothetical protein